MNTSTAENLSPISVEDYLAGEAIARHKHEYVDGMVYAMVGGTYTHNLIASNVLVELGSQLKGKPCRALNSDSKVRTQNRARTRFYYPDAMVVCGKNILQGVYQDHPSILIEVLSASTRRTDEGEKKDAYLAIAVLQAYVLFEQGCVAATVYRRTGEAFTREVYQGTNAIIEFPTVESGLSLAAVYAEVDIELANSEEDSESSE